MIVTQAQTIPSDLVLAHRRDPVLFAKFYWPALDLYDKQREMLYSIRDNDETFVASANEMGKDFSAGIAALWFFITRHPCRIITTSAKDDHLRVLWGEINERIRTSRVPLEAKRGGCLIVNHQEIKKMVGGKKCPISYILGMVANDESVAAMQGHYVPTTDGLPRTLFMVDEASALKDGYYEMARNWAKRLFLWGNCWECQNHYRKGVDGGDVPRPNGKGFDRKVIRIRATDSPNVRLGLREQESGLEPSNKIIVPGVLTYADYRKRLATYDKASISVCLDAKFYQGAENMMFPPEWLKRARDRAKALAGIPRGAEAMGVDSAEGGDNTAFVIVDRQGVIAWTSLKTPDTSKIAGITIRLIQNYKLDPTKVVFDAGGGGKQHADLLRSKGYPVRCVRFNQAPHTNPANQAQGWTQKRELNERRSAFKYLRDLMFWRLRQRLDPHTGQVEMPVGPVGPTGLPVGPLGNEKDLKDFDGPDFERKENAETFAIPEESGHTNSP